MSRVVLVTGGGRGIGAATVARFRDGGDTVITIYRSTPPPVGVIGMQCDVTDAAAVEQAMAEIQSTYGAVEVFVANAGITKDKLILRMTDDEFSAVIDTNLTAAFRIARLVSRKMAAQRRGRIVFVSSMVAYLGAAGQTSYAASKAGLMGLARSLAWELGSRGVTVNVVAPGLIETDMTDELNAGRKDALIGDTPLGRMGQPEEIAHAIHFLASEGSAFITGAVLPVSGGLAMGY
jgi:3-oxoacyl-[acyl-carrier protein] reductase